MKGDETRLMPAIERLAGAFEKRLNTIVLFGSRARGDAERDSDYDLLVIVDGLASNPLERMRQVRLPLLNVPLRINVIAKTPEELRRNLTPLLLDVCVDGICLYGHDFFDPYRRKALNALEQSGLERRRVGGEFCWKFDKLPRKDWELTWEGFHELA